MVENMRPFACAVFAKIVFVCKFKQCLKDHPQKSQRENRIHILLPFNGLRIFFPEIRYKERYFVRGIPMVVVTSVFKDQIVFPEVSQFTEIGIEVLRGVIPVHGSFPSHDHDNRAEGGIAFLSEK